MCYNNYKGIASYDTTYKFLPMPSIMTLIDECTHRVSVGPSIPSLLYTPRLCQILQPYENANYANMSLPLLFIYPPPPYSLLSHSTFPEV